MTGKDCLVQVIDLCKKVQSQVEALEPDENKGGFLKTLEKQRSTIEGVMERVFFKTPKGANSASIVLESIQKLDDLTANLAQGSPQDEKTKLGTDTGEALQDFTERVEGLVQAAQGKTLAFT